MVNDFFYNNTTSTMLNHVKSTTRRAANVHCLFACRTTGSIIVKTSSTQMVILVED